MPLHHASTNKLIRSLKREGPQTLWTQYGEAQEKSGTVVYSTSSPQWHRDGHHTSGPVGHAEKDDHRTTVSKQGEGARTEYEPASRASDSRWSLAQWGLWAV